MKFVSAVRSATVEKETSQFRCYTRKNDCIEYFSGFRKKAKTSLKIRPKISASVFSTDDSCAARCQGGLALLLQIRVLRELELDHLRRLSADPSAGKAFFGRENALWGSQNVFLK